MHAQAKKRKPNGWDGLYLLTEGSCPIDICTIKPIFLNSQETEVCLGQSDPNVCLLTVLFNYLCILVLVVQDSVTKKSF